jgi:hypothetical protein
MWSWTIKVLTIHVSSIIVSRPPKPGGWHNRPIAPGDFFLFGFMKRQIQGVHFPDRETLKGTICRIFGEIDREVLISVVLD